ncbi:hypothetical protein OBBRIDRAFT_791987 [Obba rivulosa]|uniref:F-box domain-containing protein n=1 Tax=Obba rivulosa TaxID=1052685 RepID=A0A8E2B0T3_9APHY|nr:hypothetical protein OBBRIDRAFT_791987 [Obba rivulosa]
MAASAPARSHTGATTLLDKLPAELLALIFTFGATLPANATRHILADDASVRQIVSPCQTFDFRLPLIVSAVCRRWRDVALNHQSLWSKIYITNRDVADVEDISAPPCARFPIVSEYLRRAGKYAPLDILIDSREPSCSGTGLGHPIPFTAERQSASACIHRLTSERISEVLRLLLPRLRRWRSFAFVTDQFEPMTSAVRNLAPDTPSSLIPHATGGTLAPLLEQLAFIYDSNASYTLPYRLTSPFDKGNSKPLPFGIRRDHAGSTTNTPRLRHLTLSGIHVDWARLPDMLPSPSQKDPRAGLRSLEISCHWVDHRPSAQDWYRILGQCPRLTSLAVRRSGVYELVEHTSEARVRELLKEPVPLPRLADLRLEYTKAADALFLVQALDAPHVRALDLRNAHPPYSSDAPTADLLDCLAGVSPGARGALPEGQGLFPLVKTMRLHDIQVGRASFERLFASSPLVQSLALSRTPDAALHALHMAGRPPRATMHCPSLQELRVYGGDEVADVLVEEILAERSPEGLLPSPIEFGLDVRSGEVESAILGDVDAQVDLGEVDIALGSYTLRLMPDDIFRILSEACAAGLSAIANAA